jgi:hypothetical protein
VHHFADGPLEQSNVGRGGQLVPEAEEDARAAARRAPHLQLVDQGQEVVQADARTVEAAGVMHGWIATLDDRRKAGAQHVCQPLGIADPALPDRVEDGVRVGDLLQDIGQVLRCPHRLTRGVRADVRPGLDDRNALAVQLRHLEEQPQVLRPFNDLLEGPGDAPFEHAFVCESVPTRERRR